MHLLAAVLIPFDRERAAVRPLIARDAAAFGRLDMLLFRYQESPDEARQFMFDWWALGGRWGVGPGSPGARDKAATRPTRRSIPHFLAHNAAWSEDLSRVRLTSSLLPAAIVTQHGEWKEGAAILPAFGKATVRQRKAKAAWLRKIRKLMHAHPDCLAIAVDYHC
jgi:hypothetical protein